MPYLGGWRSSSTDYLGGFQYAQGSLQFFPTAEGYVSVTGTNYNHVFNYTDHLGNIRLSYTKDPVSGLLKVLEENHYYPYGMKHSNYGASSNEYVRDEDDRVLYAVIKPVSKSKYQYKYNGKEYQDELGLNVYAYGWRDYDPAIGRFLKIDRFAEKYFLLSPYSYTGNNPVLFVDIAGDRIGSGKEHFDKFRINVIDMIDKISLERQIQISKLFAKGDMVGAQVLEQAFAKADSKIDSKMAILNQTLKELNLLEASSQIYNLFVNSKDVSLKALGNVKYDIVTNELNINLRGNFDMGNFAHELKHAYQFQVGQLSFGATGNTGGVLYDSTDEYAAYDRGAFFKGRYLTNEEVDQTYNLRKGPIDLNSSRPGSQSTYREELKRSTLIYSTDGTAQQQFYINWQNDTKK